MIEKQIWDTLLRGIGNPYGVAGLMGNLYAESALNPRNLQKSAEKKLGMTDEEYTAAVDSGYYANFERDGAGYGLAQWTYWSRKQALLDYAEVERASIGDLDMQLGFLLYELQSYRTVLATLKEARSVQEASDIVLTRYEKPADQSDAVKAKRAAYGQKYFDKFAAVAEPEEPESIPQGYDPKAVTAILLAEVGYCEKETNKQLDDPTANAGDENYTKYARDLAAVSYYNGSKTGVAWCAVFVNWGPFKAFGKEAALALSCQPSKDNCGAGCQSSYDYYKRKGQAHDGPPCEGDQIFFWNKKKTSRSHTGYVYAVDDTYVYTVEGNTSGESGVVDNGGMVAKKKYKLTYDRIAGYGRPNWGMAAVGDPEESIKTVLGSRTLATGDTGEDVKELQEKLNQLPFIVSKLATDGAYGKETERAVFIFQTVYDLPVDSKYGPVTHKVLLEVISGAASEKQEPVKRIVTLTANDVNLRHGDSTSYSRVAQLDKGTELEYVATSPNGWHAVRYKSMIAWVSGEYAEVTTA